VITKKKSFLLDFKYPTKSLYWMVKKYDFIKGNTFFGNDIETATKRIVLAYCFKSDTHFTNSSGSNLAIDSYLIPKLNLNPYISLIISNSKVKKNFKSGSKGTINDIIISSNYMLTSEMLSLTVTDFIALYAQNVNRNTSGDGSSDYDLKIYQWDNSSLNLDYTKNIIDKSKFDIDGNEITQMQTYHFYNLLQTSNNFTNIPNNGLNVYTFSINPEEYQPSGILNLSKFYKSRLIFKYSKILIPKKYYTFDKVIFYDTVNSVNRIFVSSSGTDNYGNSYNYIQYSNTIETTIQRYLNYNIDTNNGKLYETNGNNTHDISLLIIDGLSSNTSNKMLFLNAGTTTITGQGSISSLGSDVLINSKLYNNTINTPFCELSVYAKNYNILEIENSDIKLTYE